MIKSFSEKQKNIFWYLVFGAVLIFSLISAAGLEFQEDFMALVPKEKNRSGNYKELLKYFNPLDKCYFIQEFSSEGPPDESLLIESGDVFYSELQESGLFSKILYQWDYNSLQATLDLLQQYRFSLLNDEDLDILESRIQYSEMSNSFQEWKRELYTSSDPLTARQFLSDPIKINELLMNKWTGMGGEGGVTVHEGRFFSSDHTRILMIADPYISGSDSSRSEEFLKGVDDAILNVEKQYPGLKISYLSGHRYTEENASRIKRDVKLTVTLSLLVIILLSMAVYSRKFLPLMTLLPAFFGGAVALGVCRWIFPELSAIIIGCGAMLIGIAVDYGIHFLFHADSVTERTAFRPTLFSHIKKIRGPLLVSCGTTLAAFLVLLVSRLPGYRQLGVFVAVGVAASLSFVLILFPRIIPPPGKSRVFGKPFIRLEGVWERFFQFMGKYGWIPLIVLVLAVAAAVPGLRKISFDGNVSNLNAKTPAINAAYDLMLDSFGDYTASTLIAVPGMTEEDALQANEKLAAVLYDFKMKGYLTSFTTVSSVYPSLKMQNKNSGSWQRRKEEGFIETLEDSIEKAASDIGVRAVGFLPFIKGMNDIPSGPLNLEHFTGTVLESFLYNQIAHTPDGVMVLTSVSFNDESDFYSFREKLLEKNLDLILYNGDAFAKEIIDLIYGELTRLGLLAMILVVVLVFVFTRNLKKGLLLLLPLAVTVVLTFGIMGWFDVKINIMNCLVIIFIFGLVIDYAVFLITSLWEENASESAEFRNRSSSAILLSSLTTLAGLGVLILARHPALFTLGLSAVIGIACGLFSVFLIIPFLGKKLASK